MYKAMQADETIGVMLLYNIVVNDIEDCTKEVAAIHLIASMMARQNPVFTSSV